MVLSNEIPMLGEQYEHGKYISIVVSHDQLSRAIVSSRMYIHVEKSQCPCPLMSSIALRRLAIVDDTLRKNGCVSCMWE